ncbi:hypothetical protein [Rubellicoccus peritrichatus]|uniref:Uncharacterized protein n=1 Tax=Rubellicoccus peritrichatus TaxID=3080537 RepID=A0AAQ3LBC2_9BACT|nr:hypothetical protein [Puniceicoccus sp. CR14]WOO41394.1 hypothetical protein RZN69_22470 [Puniceicoccus sp. CR14]
MRTARFEIVRVLLTVIGAIVFAVIGFELILNGENGSSKAFGVFVILLLGVGLMGVIRKRKKRS